MQEQIRGWIDNIRGIIGKTRDSVLVEPSLPEVDVSFRTIFDAEPQKQSRSGACGPATLSMAYEKLGKHVSEAQIIQEIGYTDHGIGWAEILENARLHSVQILLQRNVTDAYNRMRQFFRLDFVVVVAWSTDRDKAVLAKPPYHELPVSDIDSDALEGSEHKDQHKEDSDEPPYHFSFVSDVDSGSIELLDPEYKDVYPISRNRFENQLWRDEEGVKTFAVLTTRRVHLEDYDKHDVMTLSRKADQREKRIGQARR